MTPFLPFHSLALRLTETGLGSGSNPTDGQADTNTGWQGTGFAFLDEIEQNQITPKVPPVTTEPAATKPSELDVQAPQNSDEGLSDIAPGEGSVDASLQVEALGASTQKIDMPTTQPPTTGLQEASFTPLAAAFALEITVPAAVVLSEKNDTSPDAPEPFLASSRPIESPLGGKLDAGVSNQSALASGSITPANKVVPSLIPNEDGAGIPRSPQDQHGRQQAAIHKGALPLDPTPNPTKSDITQARSGLRDILAGPSAEASAINPNGPAQAIPLSSFAQESDFVHLSKGQTRDAGLPNATLSAVISNGDAGPVLTKEASEDAKKPILAPGGDARPVRLEPLFKPDGARPAIDMSSPVSLADNPDSTSGTPTVRNAEQEAKAQLLSEVPAKSVFTTDASLLAQDVTGTAPRDSILNGVGFAREISPPNQNIPQDVRPNPVVRVGAALTRPEPEIPFNPTKPNPVGQKQSIPALNSSPKAGASLESEQLSTPTLQVLEKLNVQIREWPTESSPPKTVGQPVVGATADAVLHSVMAKRTDTVQVTRSTDPSLKTLPIKEAVPQTIRSPETQASSPVATAPLQTSTTVPALPMSLALAGPVTQFDARSIREAIPEKTSENIQAQSTNIGSTPSPSTILPMASAPVVPTQPAPISPAEPDTEEVLLGGSSERQSTYASDRASSAHPMQTTDGKLSQSIAAQLRAQVPQVLGEATEILLDPEELGRVRMTLTGQDGAGLVVLQVERPETLDLIRRNLDLMRAELADAGWQSVEFSFGQDMSDRNGEGSSSEDGGTASPNDSQTLLEASDAATTGPRDSRITQKSGLDLRL